MKSAFAVAFNYYLTCELNALERVKAVRPFLHVRTMRCSFDTAGVAESGSVGGGNRAVSST
jgi:hypothetical protein